MPRECVEVYMCENVCVTRCPKAIDTIEDGGGAGEVERQIHIVYGA